MSQYNLILAWLKAGNTIDRVYATHIKFGRCGRLAARIGEMKNAGYDIGKVMVKTTTGAYIAQYRLIKEKPNG